MGQDALAAANEIPFEDQCPEPEVIPIDFYDSGGEGRIFQRLEPGKVGRALLNGQEVWVKQFTHNSKQEVMILRDGNPDQGGHWQTWEVVRENLGSRGRRMATPASDAENLGAIARGFTRALEATAARRARMGIGRERQDEGREEAQGRALGNYLKNLIKGSYRTTVNLEARRLTIHIKGGTLNVGTMDFFSVLEAHLRRLGTMKQAGSIQTTQSATTFNGEYEGVMFNAMRALAITLDPMQHFRPRPNTKGRIDIRSEYSTVDGFKYLTFSYEF